LARLIFEFRQRLTGWVGGLKMSEAKREEGRFLVWGLGIFVSGLFASCVVLAVTVEPPKFSGYGISQYRQVERYVMRDDPTVLAAIRPAARIQALERNNR
jgi:hypothetical protein